MSAVDIVVIVAEHAAELTEFREFHFRILGVKGVTEFSRGFANAFQTAFDGVLRLRVGGELLRSHTADVGADPRNVVEDIAEASFGIARRHGFRLERRRAQRGI